MTGIIFLKAGGNRAATSLFLFRWLSLTSLCSCEPCSGPAEVRSRHWLTASLPAAADCLGLIRGPHSWGERLPSLRMQGEWAGGTFVRAWVRGRGGL